MSKSKEIDRREFMKDAVKGAAVWSCITIAGAEKAWSQAAKEQMKIAPSIPPTVKPILTIENINKLYQKVWDKPEFETYFKQAQTNLEQFLNTHFTLTPDQAKNIKMHLVSNSGDFSKFLTTIGDVTRKAARSKAAGGPPGMFETPASISGSGDCRFRACVKIWKIEFCYCA